MQSKRSVSDRAVKPDPDLAYIEREFVRAMNGDTPLGATSFEELEQLVEAWGLSRWLPRIRKPDYHFIRYVVLEKLKSYTADDNLARLHTGLR